VTALETLAAVAGGFLLLLFVAAAALACRRRAVRRDDVAIAQLMFAEIPNDAASSPIDRLSGGVARSAQSQRQTLESFAQRAIREFDVRSGPVFEFATSGLLAHAAVRAMMLHPLRDAASADEARDLRLAAEWYRDTTARLHPAYLAHVPVLLERSVKFAGLAAEAERAGVIAPRLTFARPDSHG
jgi:hypothetical protein